VLVEPPPPRTTTRSGLQESVTGHHEDSLQYFMNVCGLGNLYVETLVLLGLYPIRIAIMKLY
jgi:hypothetical protein